MTGINWKQNKEYDEFVLESTKKGMTNAQIAVALGKLIGQTIKPNQISKRKYNNGMYYRNAGVEVQSKGALQKHFEEVQEDINRPSSVNRKNDGTVDISGTLTGSPDQIADDEYLLEMFGYDKETWTVVNSSSTIWNGAIKGGKQQMYRCKITVKRLTVPVSMEKLSDIINEVVPLSTDGIAVKYTNRSKGATLLIPMYDKHFGISDLKHYTKEMDCISDEMAFFTPDTTIITLGGDLFHNDSIVHGTTTSGTLIDKVDMVKAISDFVQYFDNIMESAYKYSNKVKVIAVAGNHDTTIGYMVAKMLEQKWSKIDGVEFDVDFGYRKAIVVDGVFFGFAHGDKVRKNIAQQFALEFPKLWGKAEYREVIVGHLHSNKVEKPIIEDTMGCVVRQMPSYNKLDDYHIFNGYTSATPQTMTMIYANGSINTINHYGGKFNGKV